MIKLKLQKLKVKNKEINFSAEILLMILILRKLIKC